MLGEIQETRLVIKKLPGFVHVMGARRRKKENVKELLASFRNNIFFLLKGKSVDTD
jgi:hypothetical protein